MPHNEREAPPSAVETTETQAQPDDAVTRVLDQISLGEPVERNERPRSISTGPRLRTARIRRLDDGAIVAVFRGGVELDVDVDSDVDPLLIARAIDAKERVLIEEEPGETPIVVGVVSTRLHEKSRPDVVELKARRIVIDAEDELVLRSGSAGMRLREDGDVELVGSRIVTVSRGLFRLVGKMLRLN